MVTHPNILKWSFKTPSRGGFGKLKRLLWKEDLLEEVKVSSWSFAHIMRVTNSTIVREGGNRLLAHDGE